MKRRDLIKSLGISIPAICLNPKWAINCLASNQKKDIKILRRARSKEVYSLEDTVSTVKDIPLNKKIFPKVMHHNAFTNPVIKGVFGYITLINKDGFFVAPAHNFFLSRKQVPDREIFYFDPFQNTYNKGILLAYDRERDLALGKIDSDNLSPLDISFSSISGIGLKSEVYVPTYKNRFNLERDTIDSIKKKGRIDQNLDRYSLNLVKTRAFTIEDKRFDVLVEKRSKLKDSGSPVYNKDGHLHGIIVAIPDPRKYDLEISFAVSSHRLKRFIEQYLREI